MITDKSAKRPAAIAPEGLRRADAARFVGVSSATWSRLMAGGAVPKPIRLGGCSVWPRSWLSRWLDAGCPKAADFTRIMND